MKEKIDKKRLSQIIQNLQQIAPSKKMKITHVCGTHEMTASRYGLRSILPETVDIIPGPGCPVCVCPAREIDFAIKLAQEGKIITTFGDMMRVPASKYSLNQVKMKGADVRVVYSPEDALKIARKNPDKEVIFFAIGFETSAPMTAAIIKKNPPENFSVISAHRLTVPAMELLLREEDKKTKGFICPGHVSVIIGLKPYQPFSEKYKMPCVIAGFEPFDMLLAVYQMLKMKNEDRIEIINEYSRVVAYNGNKKALKLIDAVFEVDDARWRGIGTIAKSGLALREEFSRYDAKSKFHLELGKVRDIPKGCRCHEVMLGNILPPECPMYLKKCTPDNPVGPCMVSHEGTCAIFARYGSQEVLKKL
jgi:hydrogenase expression/formation protein HypD